MGTGFAWQPGGLDVAKIAVNQWGTHSRYLMLRWIESYWPLQ